jgi:putative serine protease PepD
VAWNDEDDDGAWTPPLPPEDRLWRHPSELAALRAGPVAVQHASTGRRAWGIGLASAIGGALAVGTLWLALDSPGGTTVTNTAVAVREISASPRLVSAPDWAAAVTDRVAASVVGIRGAAGTGSAVAIRDDGTLIAATALLGDARTAVVDLAGGRSVRATVVGSDPTVGVTVLRLSDDDADGLAGAPLAVGQVLRRGDWTAVAGAAAMPLAATVEDLVASAPGNRTGALHGLLRLDVPVPDSAVGGALVDGTGALAGIVAASVDGHAYVLPIDQVLAIVDDLDRHGRVRRAWLGVGSSDTSSGTGAVLEDVDVGGPGAAAGLRPGDVVVRVDGQPVDSVAALLLRLRAHRPGDVVPVQVARGDLTWTVEVLLGQRPG